MKIPIPLAGATALILILAGCSAGDTDSEHAQATPSAEATEETAAVEPTQVAPQEAEVPAGVVALRCTHQAGEMELIVLNSDWSPTAGPPLAEWDGSHGSPTFHCLYRGETYLERETTGHLTEVRWSQMLSPDMSLLAINWTDATTGSRRVGYLSADGTRTDVTELVAGPDGGFAAVPQHRNALFVDETTFYFVDGATDAHTWVDVNSGSILRTEPGASFTRQYWIGADGNPQMIYNMSGIAYAARIQTAQPGTVVTLYNGFDTHVWLDETTLLATMDGQVGVLEGILESQINRADQSWAPITPGTDFGIDSAYGEPDGTLYFTARRGSEFKLFSAPMDGSSTPVEVSDLSALPGAVTQLIGYSE